MNIFLKNPRISSISLLTIIFLREGSPVCLDWGEDLLFTEERGGKWPNFVNVKGIPFVTGNFLLTKIAIYINLSCFLTPVLQTTKNCPQFFLRPGGREIMGSGYETTHFFSLCQVLPSLAVLTLCGQRLLVCFCSFMQMTPW